MKVLISILVLGILCMYCATLKTIETDWTNPKMAKIEVYRQNKKIIDDMIPVSMTLKETGRSTPYYVKITTANNETLYGILEVLETTGVTELASIEIMITEAQIRNVLENKNMAVISIDDPTEGDVILTLKLGNRKPPAM